jgi:lysophospholipid hydrolase
MKTTARKELVLLHSDRSCTPTTTSSWLKLRLWIHAHYHIQMNTPATVKAHTLRTHKQPTKQMTIGNLGAHFKAFYGNSSSRSPTIQALNIYSGIRSDFSRLARRLLSKSIGLVLGGGGAKGIAHVGILRAFEEVGIPIDMVGGTSMGAFVGGVYARETDYVSVLGRTKLFSFRANSLWRFCLDLTYPIVSMTTGEFGSFRSCFQSWHFPSLFRYLD